LVVQVIKYNGIMARKTIFEWAELFKEDISNGASKSDVVQMLEDYKTEQLTIPVVSNCAVCNDEINHKGVCEICYTELRLSGLD
tara:strand:- start:1188 stop:1439 length:252 start_codon:yes stop_codon:yes gene_type:complete